MCCVQPKYNDSMDDYRTILIVYCVDVFICLWISFDQHVCLLTVTVMETKSQIELSGRNDVLTISLPLLCRVTEDWWTTDGRENNNSVKA